MLHKIEGFIFFDGSTFLSFKYQILEKKTDDNQDCYVTFDNDIYCICKEGKNFELNLILNLMILNLLDKIYMTMIENSKIK